MAAWLLLASGHVHAGTLVARAVHAETHERVTGATVVVEGPALTTTRAAITDADGSASIAALPAGIYRVTFYYASEQARFERVVVAATGTRFISAVIQASEGTVCWSHTYSPIIEPGVGIQYTVPERLRRRTSPPIGATSFEGEARVAGFRLPRGGARLPNLLADEVTIMRAGYASRWGGAAGAITSVEPHAGSNAWRRRAAIRVGSDSSETVGSLEGPLRQDHAWIAAGAGVWSGGHVALAQLAMALGPEHQGRAVLLSSTQERAGVRTTSRGSGARWTSKLHDSRTQIDVAVGRFFTGRDQSAASWSDDVRQGSAWVTRRHQMRGHHVIEVGVDAALHRRHHRDTKLAFESRELALHAHDAWSLRPNLGIELGQRVERERVHDVRGRLDRSAILPRVGAWYDWTREGRARLFGHWGRYRAPTSPGRADPIERSVGLVGLEYELVEDLAVTLAYERRGGSDGVVVAARKRRGALRLVGLARVGERDPLFGSRHTVRLDAYRDFDLCFAKRLWIGAGVRHGVDDRSAVTLGTTRDHVELRLELADTVEGPAGRFALSWTH